MKIFIALYIQRHALLIIFFLIGGAAMAQENRQMGKLPIDTGVLDKWPVISSPAISDDGKYSLYVVNDRMSGVKKLHIVANEGNWKTEVGNIKNNAQFSNSSKLIYFIIGQDSLCTFDLHSKKAVYTPDVKSFSVAKAGDWVAWSSVIWPGQLNLRNNVNNKRLVYDHVTDYKFSDDGKILLITSIIKNDGQNLQSLTWIDLTNGKTTEIWKGRKANQYIFDRQCDRLAFVATEKTENSIFCYQRGTDKADCVVTKQSPGIMAGFSIEDWFLEFSRKGDKILFSLIKDAKQTTKVVNNTDLNIWNYKDEFFQIDKRKADFETVTYNAIVHINSKHIVRLTQPGEKLSQHDRFQDYILIEKDNGAKIYYRKSYNYELVNTTDGKRIPISKVAIDVSLNAHLSPTDQFFVWFDYPSHQYLSYDLISQKKTIISRLVPVPLDNTEVPMSAFMPHPYGIIGWSSHHHSVFVYDKYDIWQLDLVGNNTPVNITNGYGRRNNTVFGLGLGHNETAYRTGEKQFESSEPFLLTGFNLTNKFNGFWLLNNVNLPENPTKLTMGPYFYTNSRGGNLTFATSGIIVIKSKNADRYLVERQTASEFPNLYNTFDFKSFKGLSNLYPEKRYNWLSSELVTWQMSDGNTAKGILYKPDNFESSKKYPVIFRYYRSATTELFAYLRPEWDGADINIPYYVSNGYLVFTPDIYYKPGWVGENTANSVLSAAHYVAKLPYVDSTKMGIDGHSFGGWETNYLVTHSNCFAAACSAAGISDQVSAANELSVNGDLTDAGYFEYNNGGMAYGPGVTPSTNPKLYEENSPVLAVQHVTTPLLICHGDLDEAVSYKQAFEMYLAMHHADKKVWLLEYEKGGHIQYGNDAKDFDIRLKQFFDYYLKNALPPVWMTRGVPASLKGIDSGLQYDHSGAKP